MVKQISLNLDGDIKQVVNVNPVFARHETFHPRFGWIKKGFDAALNSFVFVQEDAPVRLGVGKNMVNSIRYWCNAFKVLENDRPSDFGDRLLKDDGWDPYLEDPASLWLLHWNLLKPPCNAAAWYFTFNVFRETEFSQEELFNALCDYRDTVAPRIVESSLKKDVTCILRMYVEQGTAKTGVSEDGLDCPFTNLGIIHTAGDSRHYTFRVGSKGNLPAEIVVSAETISHVTDFNAKLSDVCDEVYRLGLILWNELINRRELTSQGAKARRELIEAMIENPEQERLGLQGYGSEVTMYYSILSDSGIHRQENGEWGFYPPKEESGVWTVWQAIDDFCLQAKDKPQSIDKLYKLFEAPPYGVKHGAIPVLLAAVLLYHVDDVGVYKDGTFIPVLGVEHFELLMKDQDRFAVKYFEVVGLRSQVFKELEAILRKKNASVPPKVRNSTLLMVVKPLFQFVKKLPAYTTKTKRLSSEALAVLQTLQQAQEPDELLFTSLPKACGLPPIVAGDEEDGTLAKTLTFVSNFRQFHT